MKISTKQLIMLIQLGRDSLGLGDFGFTYNLETRYQLLDDIINQQSEELKEIE